MLGGILGCVCGVTIEVVDGRKYGWATGLPHDCGADRAAWLEVITSDALDGDADAARLLPSAVEHWLAS